MKQLNKYFVFSDVHGEYNALTQALQEAGFEEGNPRHKLISVGDAFDRGPDSDKVYTFLLRNKAVCVKGNHDNFFQEYLEKGMEGEFVLFNILHNGLGATIKAFTGCNFDVVDSATLHRLRNSIARDVLSFMRKMPLYYETENFVFVHAGLHPNVKDWKNNDEHFMLWDIEHSYAQLPHINKCVIIGHHHAFRVRNQIEEHCLNPMEVGRYTYGTYNEGQTTVHRIRTYGNTDHHRPVLNGNKIAIDGCTNLTGKVNVLVFEDYELDPENPQPQPEAPKFNDDVFTTTTTTSYNGGTYTINYGDAVLRANNFFA